MSPKLPSPRYYNGRRRWRQSEILDYERAVEGLPPLPDDDPAKDPANERWLTAAQMRERFAVSDMWLWRREREAESASCEAA